MEENRINILVVVNTLNEIAVHGETDMEKMLAAIRLLKQTAEKMKTEAKTEDA